MLAEAKIAFIGSGAMGEAMINGLLAKEIVGAGQMVASDPIENRRRYMEDQYGVATTHDNVEAVRAADVVVLSVKPQVFSRVAESLYGRIEARTLVVSIIAGTPIRAIREELGHDRIVRSMPNTPAQVGKGVTVWTATAEVSETQREVTATILGALGEQIPVSDEAYLDMATGLSGSGPGFVFLLIEAMIDAGVQIGFSRTDAQTMVLQTMDGCVELVRTTQLHPAELRNRVTSPAGTTAAGLYELEAGNVRATLARAIRAAYLRSQELGALYDRREQEK